MSNINRGAKEEDDSQTCLNIAEARRKKTKSIRMLRKER